MIVLTRPEIYANVTLFGELILPQALVKARSAVMKVTSPVLQM